MIDAYAQAKLADATARMQTAEAGRDAALTELVCVLHGVLAYRLIFGSCVMMDVYPYVQARSQAEVQTLAADKVCASTGCVYMFE